MVSLISERADRIRRRAGAGSGSGNIDAAELSENSNMSSTWNEDSAHIMDTTDIHQKGFVYLAYAI